MILTAKHHDGFCLWPTRTTDALASQRARGAAARATSSASSSTPAAPRGCEPGSICSPWDRNEPLLRRFAAVQRPLRAISSTELLDAATARSSKSGSTAPTAKGPTASGRCTTGRAICGAGAAAAAEGGDVLRCRARRALDRQRDAASAGDPNWCDGRSGARAAIPGVERPGVHRALQHGDPDGTRLAAGRDRRLDPARLVLSSRPRTRGCRARTTSCELYFTLGRPQREAAAQRAADARRALPRQRRAGARGVRRYAPRALRARRARRRPRARQRRQHARRRPRRRLR